MTTLLWAMTVMGCPAPAPSTELAEPKRGPTFDALVAIEKGWSPDRHALISIPNQPRAPLGAERESAPVGEASNSSQPAGFSPWGEVLTRAKQPS